MHPPALAGMVEFFQYCQKYNEPPESKEYPKPRDPATYDPRQRTTSTQGAETSSPSAQEGDPPAAKRARPSSPPPALGDDAKAT